jgi:hypothetical protein
MSQLTALCAQIRALGFAVTLTPLLDSAVPATVTLPAAPTPPTPQGLETVEIGGTSYQRVPGSVSAMAPHGLGADGSALAPFGMLSDGSRPRKSGAGRPVKAPDSPPSPETSIDAGDLSFLDGLDSAPPAPTPAPAGAVPPSDESVDSILAGL